ncbi:MAG: TRAP transporter small permease [Pseudomonadota bacterium]
MAENAQTATTPLHRTFATLERAATAIAAFAMLTVMLLVFVDVGLRYGLNRPLPWSFNLITLYLLPCLFFLALAASWRDGRHIRIDLIFRVMPDRMRAACDLLAVLLALGLTLGFAWQGIHLTVEAWVQGRVTPGVYEWPTWASVGLMPLGMACLAVRLMVDAVRHGRGMLGLIPVPPVASAASRAE